MSDANLNCKSCQLPMVNSQTICAYCGAAQNNRVAADLSPIKKFLIYLVFLGTTGIGSWYFWQHPNKLAERLTNTNILETMGIVAGSIVVITILLGYQRPWRTAIATLLTVAGTSLLLIVAASCFETHGQLLLDTKLEMIPLGTLAFLIGILLLPLPRGTFLIKALLLWSFSAVLIAKAFLNPVKWRDYDYNTYTETGWHPLPVDSETHFYFILPGLFLAFATATLVLAAFKKAITPARQ